DSGSSFSKVSKIYRNESSVANTTPNLPTNLTSSINGDTVTLNWDKATDNETTLQDGLTYNLRIGTTPGGSEISSAMADSTNGYRRVVQLGNTNHNASWIINDLEPGTYYWSVQAIDTAFAGSAFANEKSFTYDFKLTAGDGAAGDLFGNSISISGDYAIVGSTEDDDNAANSGSAYVFKRDGDTWVQHQKLTAADGAVEDEFGRVSMSGDYAVIGARYDDDMGDASGSAYIFKRDGDTWVQHQKLTASDGTWHDTFGASVHMAGDYAIIGAPWDEVNGWNSGSAYIFKLEGGTWVQKAKLLASDGATEDRFGGAAISSDGSYAVVGSSRDDDNGADSGSIYIFEKPLGGWTDMTETHKRTPGDGQAGDGFGVRVAVSGDYIAAGASRDDDKGTDSGSVYIFKNDGSNWTEHQKLLAGDGAGGDFFGISLSLTDSVLLAGAMGDTDNGTDSGSVYSFKLQGGNWVEYQKLTAFDGAAGDKFGQALAVSGNSILVGAPYDDNNGADSGSVYVYNINAPPVIRILQPDGLDDIANTSYTITWTDEDPDYDAS
ncbi:MAG: hypothetical protein GY869_22735, partial [Planctomycetes bacterium]|nr:hypothetical protein [Planctomycetota bacterium]